MATLPTAEEMERVILGIFSSFNIRENEMLLINTFIGKIIDLGYRMEDFELGMDSLIEKGFVIIKKGNPNMYFLTGSGFDAM